MNLRSSTLVVLVVAVSIRAASAEEVPADAGTAVDRASAVFVNLKPHYSMLASEFAGYTRFPAWKAVPRGYQIFHNVPLKIDGRMCLWGEKNEKINGQTFPESIDGIEVNQKFETLYIYHCAFFEDIEGTPVYSLILRYADGSSSSEPGAIRCGEDVKDWYGDRGEKNYGPTDKRSLLAWKGEATVETWGRKRVQPLRFCLTAIANPHPERLMKSIDVRSDQWETAGCILAMTVGKSKLLRRPNPK